MGNKTKLMDVIDDLIVDNGLKQPGLVFCDAFCGTGSVSDHFSDTFRIISNDNLAFAAMMAEAKLHAADATFANLPVPPFEYFNGMEGTRSGFVTQHYSPAGPAGRMYFSIENAMLIDTIRQQIEDWHRADRITDIERSYLVSCLLDSASKVANIAGVYGAYLKQWDPRALKRMQFVDIEKIARPPSTVRGHRTFNLPVLDLIEAEGLQGDILYLDPPYTNNKYTTQYHVLETIAKMDDPDVKGITGARDMSSYNNDFSNKHRAMSAFERIVRQARFRYIILSYSSDGLMPEEFIKNTLCRYGKPETLQVRKIPYARYNNHKSVNNEDHYESLFFIEKDAGIRVASPLNYQGGKHDMVDFLGEHAPKGFDRFFDLFGGGFSVGANLGRETVVYNDVNSKVAEILAFFYTTPTAEILSRFERIKTKYGLEKMQKGPYMKLREAYNASKDKKPEILFMLMMYGFQQQFRFNSKHEYNNPIGQSSYNDRVVEKIVSFSNHIKTKRVAFFSKDYEAFEDDIQPGDFVYVDPPYLITLGSYNDGKRGFNGWNEAEEQRLLAFLDRLDQKGVSFMMSNVMTHKGKTNHILASWVQQRGHKTIPKALETRGRKEVVIVNY
jgi:adenine-specific DNA-methyltransferase